jgi:GH15 family glucan-1,4-alpha-glucosidase
MKKIRNICATIFQYFDKTNTIYVKYFQKTISKIDTTIEEKIEKSKYMPILLDNDAMPLFYIAVCKK